MPTEKILDLIKIKYILLISQLELIMGKYTSFYIFTSISEFKKEYNLTKLHNLETK